MLIWLIQLLSNNRVLFEIWTIHRILSDIDFRSSSRNVGTYVILNIWEFVISGFYRVQSSNSWLVWSYFFVFRLFVYVINHWLISRFSRSLYLRILWLGNMTRLGNQWSDRVIGAKYLLDISTFGVSYFNTSLCFVFFKLFLRLNIFVIFKVWLYFSFFLVLLDFKFKIIRFWIQRISWRTKMVLLLIKRFIKAWSCWNSR